MRLKFANLMRTLLFLLTSVLCPLSAVAEEETLQTGTPYRYTGVVDGINPSNNEVVLNDTLYRIAPSFQVHSGGTSFSGISYLKEGMQVGFNVAASGGNEVTEIWVLPKAIEPSSE